MGFWIELGVSGFRMDAVPFVIATRVRTSTSRASNTTCCVIFREFLQWREGDSIILAEANVLPNTDMQYFGDDGDRMHMMFNFQVNQNLFYALAAADVRPLVKAMEKTKPRPASGQWGLFLRNHDELDLGRLDARSSARRCSRHSARTKRMQLYDRGIRRRLAPMLGGDRRRLELAYSLMFTLPGTPVLRYGDELGMGDDLSLPERNCGRTPMQWSTEPNGGFTKSDKPVVAGHHRRTLRLRARQRGRAAARSELDAELDGAHHPHAQGGARSRLGRLRGARYRRRPPCWRCAMTGATIRFCSCTIWTASRARWNSRPGSKGEKGDLLVNLLGDEHSHAERERQTQRLPRGLRLSLVPRRRARIICSTGPSSTCPPLSHRAPRPSRRTERRPRRRARRHTRRRRF